MKFSRFLIVAALTSLPLLSLPAMGQQEIDPDHFDQPVTAKPARPTTKPKASSKTALLNRQKKAVAYTSQSSRPRALSRHAEPNRQSMALVHSIAE